MPDDLQPGLHLSPDQLSAFAENVLPEHERLTALTHLSACADCRKVVFLTQQADPTFTAAPAAETPRRSWLSLPQILVAAGAALACTLILALIIHHQLGQTTSPVTTAQLQPQPAIVPHPTAPSTLTLTPAPAPQKAAATPPHADDAQLSTAATHSLAESRMSAAPAPRPLPKIEPQKIVLPPPPALRAYMPSSGTVSGQAEESKMRAKRAYVAGASQGASASAAAPSAAKPESNLPVTVAAAPARPVTIESSNATVNVDAESIQAPPLSGRAVQNYAALTPGIVPPLKLPSKKPFASQLSAGSRILALDTAGALFLTTDSGRHWRSIAPQWSGKAVQLSFAPSPARLYLNQPSQNQTQNSSSQTNSYINGASAAPQQSQQSPIPTAGFELTTSTGTVWISTDGLTWNPR